MSKQYVSCATACSAIILVDCCHAMFRNHACALEDALMLGSRPLRICYWVTDMFRMAIVESQRSINAWQKARLPRICSAC